MNLDKMYLDTSHVNFCRGAVPGRRLCQFERMNLESYVSSHTCIFVMLHGLRVQYNLVHFRGPKELSWARIMPKLQAEEQSKDHQKTNCLVQGQGPDKVGGSHAHVTYSPSLMHLIIKRLIRHFFQCGIT